MSTVRDIEQAIQLLSKADREKLADHLRVILPELNADSEWARIIHDARPRPALSALGDSVEAQLRADPDCFPVMQDTDFDRPQ
jgi:hypothetical protein